MQAVLLKKGKKKYLMRNLFVMRQLVTPMGPPSRTTSDAGRLRVMLKSLYLGFAKRPALYNGSLPLAQKAASFDGWQL
jgi:hypothetical protein